MVWVVGLQKPLLCSTLTRTDGRSYFGKPFANALDRGYALYILVCFLCLAVSELRNELAATRWRTLMRAGSRLRGMTCVYMF